MLIRGVIDHELGDDPQIAAVRLADKVLEVVHPPVGRVDVLVVGNVVAVVAQRRGIERQQPQGGDAEVLQVVELAAQPLKVADAVVVGVEEGLDVQLIDDRVLVPQRVRGRGAGRRAAERQRCGDIVGWAHSASLRSRRKISAGLVSGSRRNRWCAPRQVRQVPVNASSSENAGSAASPSVGERQFDIGLMGGVRVEIDDDDHGVGPVARRFSRRPGCPGRRRRESADSRTPAAPDCRGENG